MLLTSEALFLLYLDSGVRKMPLGIFFLGIYFSVGVLCKSGEHGSKCLSRVCKYT
jgi:hypothetical protein